MTNYTRGEWFYANGAIQNGNHVIAEMNYVGDNVEADAHLIAAAPNMYEALKCALDLCDLREGATREVVEKALAEAEGKDA